MVPRDPSDAFVNSKAMTEKPNRKQVEKLRRVQQMYEDGAQKTRYQGGRGGGTLLNRVPTPKKFTQGVVANVRVILKSSPLKK